MSTAIYLFMGKWRFLLKKHGLHLAFLVIMCNFTVGTKKKTHYEDN